MVFYKKVIFEISLIPEDFLARWSLVKLFWRLCLDLVAWIKLFQLFFINRLDVLVFVQDCSDMVNCFAVDYIIAWVTHGLHSVTSDQFANPGLIVDLFLLKAQTIIFVLLIDRIDRQTWIIRVVANETCWMSFQQSIVLFYQISHMVLFFGDILLLPFDLNRSLFL